MSSIRVGLVTERAMPESHSQINQPGSSGPLTRSPQGPCSGPANHLAELRPVGRLAHALVAA